MTQARNPTKPLRGSRVSGLDVVPFVSTFVALHNDMPIFAHKREEQQQYSIQTKFLGLPTTIFLLR